MSAGIDPFPGWVDSLRARHLERLTFPEIRRSLQALSSLYVERRDRIGSGAALDGAGKRAAFALFYAPLHFLLVREIVRALGTTAGSVRRLLEFGCGTGAASAGWALAGAGRQGSEVAAAKVPDLFPSEGTTERGVLVTGFDRSGWALDEARWNWRQLGVKGRAERLDLERAPLPKSGEGLLAAFTVNELEEESRERLRERLLDACLRGGTVLVIEPISRRAAPWFDLWAEAFRQAGGRADTWRLPVVLPEFLQELDRAAGLDHSMMTGRSLFLAGNAAGSASRRNGARGAPAQS